MKRRISIFIAAVLSSLLVVPAINVRSTPDGEPIKWQEKAFLFNMDFVAGQVAGVLYQIGISTAPRQVVIGNNGWLHLGDQYANTLSDDRRIASEGDFAQGRKISAASEAWETYLSSKGVRLFRVMVGPNKGSIYPEHLPEWAKPARPNPTDVLFTSVGSQRHLDLRPALLAAKANQAEPLYYLTDTHWNLLGSAMAFQAFAKRVGTEAPELRWPAEALYKTSHTEMRQGGDLEKFLHMNAGTGNPDPVPHAFQQAIQVTHHEFDTGQILHEGANLPIGTPTGKALLVTSPDALNDKKVLWLRDSFGTALSPLMSASFSQVLQLYWSEAMKPDGRLIELVDSWKPDYVFVTVVERDARSDIFTHYPPPVTLPMPASFRPTLTSMAVDSNAVEREAASDNYRIKGNDPYIDFALSAPVSASAVRHLSIDLQCMDGTAAVPLQFFWLEAGRPYFDGEHSVRFSLKPGKNLLDLRTLKAWDAASSITRVRLDIDAPDGCVAFKLKAPALG